LHLIIDLNPVMDMRFHLASQATHSLFQVAGGILLHIAFNVVVAYQLKVPPVLQHRDRQQRGFAKQKWEAIFGSSF
jgi:hypothetical protein